MRTEKVFIENKYDEKISAVIHRPEKKPNGTILLQHGFYSNKEGSWKRRADYFAKNGFESVRFDRRGYGESDREFHEFNLTTGIEDSISVIDFLENNEKENYSISGSSFGGLIAIHTALKDRRIGALALRAPVTYHRSVFSDLKEKARRKGKVEPDEMENGHIEWSFFKNLESYKTEEAAKKLDVPTIVFHGNQDSTVPIEESRSFYKTINADKRFEEFNKEGHIFSEEKDRETLKRSVEWFSEKL